jgi:membrane-associated phospholipid phosphatase
MKGKKYLPFRICAYVLPLSLLLLPLKVARGENAEITEAGDILQIALPAAAGVATLLEKDWEGSKQFAYHFGTSWGTVYALKFGVTKIRPSESNRYSFPSGHTMGAFAGSSFIEKRYGLLWGVPAHLLAAFVGYSRVQADAHYLDDVLAGASISFLSSRYWVSPYAPKVMVAPMAVRNGVGVQVNVSEGKGRKAIADIAPSPVDYPRFRFAFSFGPAFLGENNVRSPAGSGTAITLDSFDKQDDPTTTAGISLDTILSDHHTLTLSFDPFESRDNGRFSEPVSFAGMTFPAGAEIRSAYRYYEGKLRYSYNLFRNGPWILKFGASLSFQWTTIKLEDKNGGPSGQAEDWVVVPLVHAQAGYKFTDRWRLTADGSWMSLSTNCYREASVQLRHVINRHWDVGGGYRYYANRIDTAELYNDVTYNILFFSVGYTF